MGVCVCEKEEEFGTLEVMAKGLGLEFNVISFVKKEIP